MDRAQQISKKAFIARMNELRRRRVVDTKYVKVGEETRLVLELEDGSKEIFKGMRAA